RSSRTTRCTTPPPIVGRPPLLSPRRDTGSRPPPSETSSTSSAAGPDQTLRRATPSTCSHRSQPQATAGRFERPLVSRTTHTRSQLPPRRLYHWCGTPADLLSGFRIHHQSIGDGPIRVGEAH